MTPAVKLADLVDALDMQSEELSPWLDRQTSEILTIQSEVISAVETEDDDPEGLPDWEKAERRVARGIRDEDPRYLALPDKFDFHEYRYMERFIGTVTDARVADQLWRAIKGKGAFRHFKDTAHRLGLIEDWYRYRDDAASEFMLRWAKANDVPVDETPHGPLPP